MLDKVAAKKFQNIVGTKAVLTIMDGPDIELTIEEVIATNCKKDDEERPTDCRKDPFSVILSGPVSNQAPDGTYNIKFEKIGILEMLYVDNKSDNPETEKFNQDAAKEAHGKRKMKAKSKSDSKDNDKEIAPGAMPPLEPEEGVLYEIIFG